MFGARAGHRPPWVHDGKRRKDPKVSIANATISSQNRECAINEACRAAQVRHSCETMDSVQTMSSPVFAASVLSGARAAVARVRNALIPANRISQKVSLLAGNDCRLRDENF